MRTFDRVLFIKDVYDLKNELLGFLVYYNDYRPHSLLQELTPKGFREKEKTNYVTYTLRNLVKGRGNPKGDSHFYIVYQKNNILKAK